MAAKTVRKRNHLSQTFWVQNGLRMNCSWESSISHPVPSGGHAAVGVQLGFLLLLSMFSTGGGFLKAPSVLQMLCSDLLAVLGSDPTVGPWQGTAWL